MSFDLTLSSPWAFQPPTLPRYSFPTLPTLSLSATELVLIEQLQRRARGADRQAMELSERYYQGEQVIQHLGIAIPQEMQFLRTLVGWPRIAVDPYVERLKVDGFRLRGATDSDADMQDLMVANGLDSEDSMAFTDALSMGRCYWTVGTNPDGGLPLIRAESPLNVSVLYGVDGRTAKAGLQGYYVDGRPHAALYTPEQTVQIAQNDKGEWEVVGRDEHNFGRVALVRMANRPRTSNRDGSSQITPELRNVVDQACRTLLILAFAGEIWAVPRVLLLGATAADFQDAQGNPKTAWETYISALNALERDDDGNVPEIRQLVAYDPSTFTKVLDWHASHAAGILAASPQDLGLYTQGNPTSEGAAGVNDGRRDRRARQMQNTFGVALVERMQLSIRFQNNGALPEKYRQMVTDWADPSIETPGITADAISKYVAAGVLPPRSDVTLKRARFSAVERARIAQDWAEHDQQDALTQIADAVEALSARGGAAPTPQQQVTSGDATPAVPAAG